MPYNVDLIGASRWRRTEWSASTTGCKKSGFFQKNSDDRGRIVVRILRFFSGQRMSAEDTPHLPPADQPDSAARVAELDNMLARAGELSTKLNDELGAPDSAPRNTDLQVDQATSSVDTQLEQIDGLMRLTQSEISGEIEHSTPAARSEQSETAVEAESDDLLSLSISASSAHQKSELESKSGGATLSTSTAVATEEEDDLLALTTQVAATAIARAQQKPAEATTTKKRTGGVIQRLPVAIGGAIAGTFVLLDKPFRRVGGRVRTILGIVGVGALLLAALAYVMSVS